MTATVFPNRAAAPTLIEIAPGKSTVDLPRSEVPRVAVADWLPQGDGTYKPIARIHLQRIRLTQDLPARLGLGCSYETLKRLIKAGFIKGGKVAPGQYTFCLQSLYEHIDKCDADPEFWSGNNLRNYLECL